MMNLSWTVFACRVVYVCQNYVKFNNYVTMCQGSEGLVCSCGQ